jgi:hypothetical protein
MKDFTDRLEKYSGWIKSLILAGTIMFIYMKLEKELSQFHPEDVQIASSRLYLIVASFLLIPLNLSLEALKWQTIAGNIERISFRQSIAGILSGLTLGFITPHAIGDYVGRIWQLKSSGRLQTIGGILVGRVSQLMATMTFGVLGILISPKTFDPIVNWSLGLGYVIIVGFVGLLFLRSFYITRLLERVGLKKITIYFRIIERYDWGNRWRIVGLSFMRYVVFCVQFMLILYYFKVSDSWIILFSGASFIFLSKSILPSFNFLSDLGIREASTVFYFGTIAEAATVPAILASLLLWGMNILLPSIAGIGLIFSLRIFRK